MAQRTQVGPLRGTPEIRPVARPVDNYYRPVADQPDKPQPGAFDALAEALERAQPAAQKFLGEMWQEKAEDEIKKGAAARDLNKKQFKEAQKLGLIKEAQNPYFIKGYMKQDGRLQGIDYDAALRLAWANDPSRSDNDITKFDAFKTKFREEYLKDKGELTGNLDWMDGFRPAMVGSETNLTAHHISHRQSEISKAVRENTGREIFGMLKQSAEAGTISAPDAATANAAKAGLGALISKRLTELVAGGLDGSDANEIATQTLAVYALETKDPSVFAVADSISTGPGGKLSGTAAFKAKKLQVVKQIQDQEWTDRRRQYEEEDRPWVLKQREWAQKVHEHTEKEWKEQQTSRDKTEQAKGLLGELTNAVLDGKPIDRAKLTKLTDISPRDGAWVESFRKQSLKDDKTIETDMDAYRDLMIRIAENPSNVSERDIFGPMGIAWKAEDARAAFNEWQQVKKDVKADKNPMIEDAVSDLRGSLITTETSVKGEGRLNAMQAERKIRLAARSIVARTDISDDEKRELIEKRTFEIAKIYNSRAVERSKAAQDAGVTVPKAPKDTPTTQNSSDRDIAAGAVAGGVGSVFKTQEPKTGPSETAKKNSIPDGAVADLIAAPWTIRQFDETFGEGMGEAILRESLQRKGK